MWILRINIVEFWRRLLDFLERLCYTHRGVGVTVGGSLDHSQPQLA